MITILIIVVLIGALLIIRSYRKSEKWMKAFDLHNDMFDKYVELAEDPLVTDAEWKEWLPVFEEADKIFARDCPDMKLEPLSPRIRKIINNEESIQD